MQPDDLAALESLLQQQEPLLAREARHPGLVRRHGTARCAARICEAPCAAARWRREAVASAWRSAWKRLKCDGGSAKNFSLDGA